MPKLRTACVLLHALTVALAAQGVRAQPRVLPAGNLPQDRRLGPLKDLNGYFPFTPSPSRDAWNVRAERVRRQVLVAEGLWPLPPRTPANAVVHGKVQRDGYTVERVYLESYPGHFVTGSLYRPTNASGQRAGVLFAHGHWKDGRFHDQGRENIRNQIVQGAERFESGRYVIQAPCAALARLGCVVFSWDMIGYADSQQLSFNLAHRYGQPRPDMETPEDWGFFSPQAELRLQTIMGLQTYNSLRVLDWFVELPDVDPERIGVTGASGGGTQTFLLGAIDPRPAVQMPAVMVSTAMQGGCTCENCSLLRIGTGNVEFAAMFAPKPMGLTGADDWTKEIATKGFPELQAHYKLLGAPDNVMVKPLLQFPHNYNYVSRAAMYAWFNKHLGLGHADPIVEEDFVPLSIAEMTVWDDRHPKPSAGDDYERELLRRMTSIAQRQFAGLVPDNAESLAEYRRVIGGAWEVLVGRGLPSASSVEWKNLHEQDRGLYTEYAGVVRRPADEEELPTVFLHPKQWNRRVVVWIDPRGKAGMYGSDGSPRAEVHEMLKRGTAVAGIDLLYQGEFLAAPDAPVKNRRVENPRLFAGYTYGYNSPLFSQRVQDVLTLVAFVRNHEDKPERVDLLGTAGAGHIVVAAAALAGSAVDRVASDTTGFRFARLTAFDDADFLPGAVKYGDLPGALALIAPRPLRLTGEAATDDVVAAAYRAAGASNQLQRTPDSDLTALVKWLAE